MEQTDEEFFHDFRQELLAGAEANGSFQLSEFMEAIAERPCRNRLHGRLRTLPFPGAAWHARGRLLVQ